MIHTMRHKRENWNLGQAISNYLKKATGVVYDPETEIVVTVGATEAINATLFSITNPGDKVAIPTPVFSLYWPVATLAECRLCINEHVRR